MFRLLPEKPPLFSGGKFTETAARTAQRLAQSPPVIPSEVRTEFHRLNGAQRKFINIGEPLVFSYRSEALGPTHPALLDRLAAYLRAHPEFSRIEIQSYASDYARNADNLLLSRQRAEHVRDYLIQQGIRPLRFTIRPYGAYPYPPTPWHIAFMVVQTPGRP